MAVLDREALSVRRSRTGLGLFTGVDVEKGVKVAEYVGRLLTAEEYQRSNSLYLFEVSARRTIDGSPRWNLARYINHSCRPNCEAVVSRGRVFIVARRKIKAGEELHYDYGRAYFKDLIAPRGCRCLKCEPETKASRPTARAA